MHYLIVAAHPDDEVLGAGGTIRRLVDEGNTVDLAVMCMGVAVRYNISDSLSEDMAEAQRILGVSRVYPADFPNIQMNTVPHLRLVQFVEKALADSGAEVVITHHPADTNDDHVQTSHAAAAAVRLFQRRPGIAPLRQLLYMEIPSSTEWALDSSANRFTPNYFVEIHERGVEAKLAALAAYKGVSRPYPHPRSPEAVTALALWRGAQAGCDRAEAFEEVFRRE